MNEQILKTLYKKKIIIVANQNKFALTKFSL